MATEQEYMAVIKNLQAQNEELNEAYKTATGYGNISGTPEQMKNTLTAMGAIGREGKSFADVFTTKEPTQLWKTYFENGSLIGAFGDYTLYPIFKIGKAATRKIETKSNINWKELEKIRQAGDEDITLDEVYKTAKRAEAAAYTAFDILFDNVQKEFALSEVFEIPAQ